MIEVNFYTNAQEFENEYLDIVRAFYPHVKIDESADTLELNLEKSSEYEFHAQISLKDIEKEYRYFL